MVRGLGEGLPMKSYQFFTICKRLDKEREKTLAQQSMRNEKKRKVGLCFCFILLKYDN